MESTYVEGKGNISRYITYADEDTLSKEIKIDRGTKEVYEDTACIDWTQDLEPRDPDKSLRSRNYN